MQQQLFQRQPQMSLSTTNTIHFNIPELHTVFLNITSEENYWLLSTNQILSYYQLSSSQLCDDTNFLSQTCSNKQQHNLFWQLLNCGIDKTLTVDVLMKTWKTKQFTISYEKQQPTIDQLDAQ